MKLTGKEAREVVWEDNEDWEKVDGSETIEDQRRWTTTVGAVFQHVPTGKFYQFYWEHGSTECQDTKPFEYDKEVTPVEVELVEVVKKEWRPVKDEKHA